MYGWILDCYPDYDRGLMVTWLLSEKGPVRREEAYVLRIYVGGEERQLRALAKEYEDNPSVHHVEMVSRLRDIRHTKPGRVLEIGFNSYGSMSRTAREIDARGRYREFDMYNVDVPLSLRYLSHKGLFPNALVRIGKGLELRDSGSSMDYSVPDFTIVRLHKERMAYHSPKDPIGSLKAGETTLRGTDEDILDELENMVGRVDPDIILTREGDYYLMPYLRHRASLCQRCLSLDRDHKVIPHNSRRSRSYFTYGQVVYKPAPFFLKGRLHLDTSSFLYREGGLVGILDLSRLSGIGLQRQSRLSPGTAISAMQVRQAAADGYLIRWKKNIPEDFKTARKLLNSDRGGHMFDPKVGLFSHVTELDFTSLYPFIMINYNISPETLGCGCCKGDGNKVPGLGYHTCVRRKGLLAKVLGPVVRRRVFYKRRARADGPDAEAYKKRSDTLKWLLVTAFGYTGYRNARFGRIECHESVTAYGREILLDAKEIAERYGYEILHGIVDSLWLKGDPEKAGAAAEEISRSIGIPLEVEGRYKWIVFLPNKGNGVGALNRYYGAFEDGKMKVRGLETRRRDTPAFIRDFQNKVLELFGAADTAQELTALIYPALDMAKRAAKRLMQRKVDPRCLVFSKTISKPLDDYKVICDQVSCLYQMRVEGMKVAPGQSVRFVITDSRSRDPRTRVCPEMHVGENTRYDAKAYIHHLSRALASLTLPFGRTEKDIFERII